jgi:hypothetical protein
MSKLYHISECMDIMFEHNNQIHRTTGDSHTLGLFGDVRGEKARPFLLISLLGDVTCKTKHKSL